MIWYRSDRRNPNDYKTIMYLLTHHLNVDIKFYTLKDDNFVYFKFDKFYQLDLNNNSIDALLNKPRGLKLLDISLYEIYKEVVE